MTDQPGYVLDEAFKLLDAVRRRLSAGDSAREDDVWSEAVREERAAGTCPHGCPVCRAMEAARASGPDVLGHVVDAGQSLFAAVQDLLGGYERTRPGHPGGEDQWRAQRAPREGEHGSGGEDDPLDIG